MPIDEMPIDIWFMCTVQVAQLIPTIVSAWSKNRVFDLWTAVSDRNINSSIEARLSGNSSFYLVVGVWGPDMIGTYCTGGKQSTDSARGLASTIAIAIT